MASDFNYVYLDLDRDYPVNRGYCNALKDPEHEIPTRCKEPYNHLGNHKVDDHVYHIHEEWPNEDPL